MRRAVRPLSTQGLREEKLLPSSRHRHNGILQMLRLGHSSNGSAAASAAARANGGVDGWNRQTVNGGSRGLVVACGLAALAPTAAMAQIPFMIPNFNFGPQHYRSGSSHYSTRSRTSHHEEENKAPSTRPRKRTPRSRTRPRARPAQHQQQTSGPPPSHDAAPSGGSERPASPPPAAPAKKNNDDQPAFQPSR